MFFIISITLVSAVFFIVVMIQLFKYADDFPTELFKLMLAASILCLCVITTWPVAIYELKALKKELKELKEQRKIETVYEPVNEILYRKCEQK